MKKDDFGTRNNMRKCPIGRISNVVRIERARGAKQSAGVRDTKKRVRNSEKFQEEKEMKKITKRILTVALALTMMMGMVLSVSAVPVPAPPALNEDGVAMFQKVLQVPAGVAQPEDDFDFEFEAKGVLAADGTLITTTTAPGYVAPSSMPAIGTITIEDTDLALDSDTVVSGFQIFKGNKDALAAFDADDFPHAGVYLYHVKEKPPTTLNPNMTYSIAEYDMYVYVSNVDSATPDGTLKIDDVGFRITQFETTGLVQPPVATPAAVTPTPMPGSNTTAPKDNPVFTNRFAPPADLEVNKKVTGEFADTERAFIYTLVINRPQAVADASTAAETYVGSIYNAGNATPVGTVTVSFAQGAILGAITSSTVTTQNGTFLLKHNQTLDFLDTSVNPIVTDPGVRDGLPAGSTYALTEAGTPGYTVAVDIWNNEDAGDPKTETQPALAGTSGNPLTINNTTTGGTRALTLGDGQNRSEWLNTYQVVTPTGILLNNLPFILLIVVAVGGFVLYIASKRRKASN